MIIQYVYYTYRSIYYIYTYIYIYITYIIYVYMNIYTEMGEWMDGQMEIYKSIYMYLYIKFCITKQILLKCIQICL